MHACRFSPGIQYQMPLLLHDPGLQCERDDVSVPQLPRLAAGILGPSRLFHALPQLHFGKAHTHGHQRVIGEARRGRVPIALCDDELDGLEPRLALRIVAIPHTDQMVTVLLEQLLVPF